MGSFLTGHAFPYTSELFPSTVRGFATGFWVVVGTSFSSLIPYIGLLTDKIGVHFLSGFVPFALLGFVMSFFLPETIHDTLNN